MSDFAEQIGSTMEKLVATIEEINKIRIDFEYDKHRLSYTYDDDDTPDGDGKPTQLFVCRCREGFDRRAFNAHIRDAYKGVLDGETTQR